MMPTFGIAPALAREIVWENDEAGWYDETPESRWKRMRAWVASRTHGEGVYEGAEGVLRGAE